MSLFDSSRFDASAPSDEPAEQQALVALSLVPGVGPGRIRSLLARFGTAEAVMHAAPAALAETDGVGPQTAQAIRAFDDHAAVEEQLRRAAQVGATLVAAWDERFPRLLRQIYDPPAFLWMRGDLQPKDERAVAIVGTRRCTEYGRQQARRFSAELAGRGFTIVSGLAYGIDAAAHAAALEAGGRTVAVLGSGVDRIYPARHTRMAHEIIQGQGAVISEYALGAAPDAPNFPRRNRIISGMTLGTLVVEAHETGGALITARLATEQNREVFAVPSPVHSAAGTGTSHLIQRSHAKLVLSADDILEELGVENTSTPAPAEAAPPPDLNPVEERLYDALEAEPIHIDALCEKTDLDASDALVYLLSLEFKGLVRQMAGKQFYRV